jgi:hypothetical protein
MVSSGRRRERVRLLFLSDEGERWVVEKLRRSPKKVRLLTRYQRMIEEDAADMNLNGKETASECKESPIVDLFEGEDPDNAHRAKRLRIAKERIAEHLAMIDKELKELESTNENGGKIE